MSYEGFTEYLCEKGHYWANDCYNDGNRVCGVCNGAAVWRHSVDQTNGMMSVRDDPHGETRRARLKVVRHEEYVARRPIFSIPKKGRIKAHP